MRANYNRIRPDVLESLEAYVETGRPTGGFLAAVLENNLSEAFGRADEDNIAAMFHIVSYVYNEMPSASWGSMEKHLEWRRHRGREGLLEDGKPPFPQP